MTHIWEVNYKDIRYLVISSNSSAGFPLAIFFALSASLITSNQVNKIDAEKEKSRFARENTTCENPALREQFTQIKL